MAIQFLIAYTESNPLHCFKIRPFFKLRHLFTFSEEMELNKLPLNLIPIASERVFMR